MGGAERGEAPPSMWMTRFGLLPTMAGTASGHRPPRALWRPSWSPE